MEGSRYASPDSGYFMPNKAEGEPFHSGRWLRIMTSEGIPVLEPVNRVITVYDDSQTSEVSLGQFLDTSL